MSHKVFIRHTYIYQCGDVVCGGEWKVNEAGDMEHLSCPHCGKRDYVDFVIKDQRKRFNNRFE